MHRGPWSQNEIDRFLDSARIPIRLAAIGTSGFPVLASLWFLARDRALWCATQRTARIVTLLERDPRCAFEVSGDSPPYRGVRGQGSAAIHPDRGEEVLRLLLERYLPDGNSRLAEFLLSRVEAEVAIEIRPDSWLSWDFRDRMQDAVSEGARA